MWLTNLQNVRIHEYDKGFVVEIQKKTWYGRKYWTHLISVFGIESDPWYFSSYDFAIQEAVKYFRWDLIRGSRDFN